ncbi:MAG: hypothetical protein H0Z37_00700 [Firmicutes bacterium]|nr:hypothetical protein [Bacillota bacterium]
MGRFSAARMSKPGLCWALAAAIVLAATSGAAFASPTDKALVPARWGGFTAVMGDSPGVFANPAALRWLDRFVVRAQVLSPLADWALKGHLLNYLEPDTGLGSGQLAYYKMSDGTGELKQYVYSIAQDLGERAAVGINLRYSVLAGRSGDEVDAWLVDVGLQAQASERVTLGAVVRNAIRWGNGARADQFPLSAAVGLAVDLGRLTLGADYVHSDLSDPLAEGLFHVGLQGRFGNILARIGQHLASGSKTPFSYAGLGFQLETFRLDVDVYDEAGGRAIVIGFTFYF